MAVVDYNAISNALSQSYESEIAFQMNREQVLLRLLPKKVGRGKNMAWDMEFSGATVVNYPDGADVLAAEYASDITVPATLNWGLYRSSQQLGGLAMAVAGTSESPTELHDLFREKLFGGITKLGSQINKDLSNGTGLGTGGNPNILGFTATAGPLDATGTYAGVARATYSELAGNLLANGGAQRPLTFDLLRQANRAMFQASGLLPDIIVADPVSWDKLGELFDTQRRWVDEVRTAAGLITLTGGFRALEFDGIPVVRDKDMPAGTMLGLLTHYIDVMFLPTRPGQSNTGENGTYQVIDDQRRESGLPARIEMLGKTGDSDKFFVKIYVGLRERRPNASWWLKDLNQS